MRISSTPITYPGSLTDVAGLEVGHYTDTRRPTGCSVVVAREGAVAGVDVRGAAPGTRETDLLQPANLVDKVHAITLSGGSAWGLDAASGVMRWLEENGIGLSTGYGLVPIVPAAVVFDLGVGDARIRPDAQAGYQACKAASRQPPTQGNVGAGSGALVGKLFGMARAMKDKGLAHEGRGGEGAPNKAATKRAAKKASVAQSRALPSPIQALAASVKKAAAKNKGRKTRRKS